jgi:hypothetical protein
MPRLHLFMQTLSVLALATAIATSSTVPALAVGS